MLTVRISALAYIFDNPNNDYIIGQQKKYIGRRYKFTIINTIKKSNIYNIYITLYELFGGNYNSLINPASNTYQDCIQQDQQISPRVHNTSPAYNTWQNIIFYLPQS